MLEPLEQFICDECGGIINCLRDGYVEWEDGYDAAGNCFARGFRIVHHPKSSPFKTREGCYKYGQSDYRHDIDLGFFLEHSHQYLTSFLDLGIVHDPNGKRGCAITDFREFVDFARRLTIPYYEEARQYISSAIQDGFMVDANELSFYTPENLKRIIERYAH